MSIANTGTYQSRHVLLQLGTRALQTGVVVAFHGPAGTNTRWTSASESPARMHTWCLTHTCCGVLAGHRVNRLLSSGVVAVVPSLSSQACMMSQGSQGNLEQERHCALHEYDQPRHVTPVPRQAYVADSRDPFPEPAVSCFPPSVIRPGLAAHLLHFCAPGCPGKGSSLESTRHSLPSLARSHWNVVSWSLFTCPMAGVVVAST